MIDTLSYIYTILFRYIDIDHINSKLFNIVCYNKWYNAINWYLLIVI